MKNDKNRTLATPKKRQSGFLLLIALAAILAGCNSGKKSQQETAVPVIDLNADYPKWKTSDAESDYIPLETRDDVLIDKSNSLIYLSDSRIVMTNRAIGDIFVFDGEGKVISRFNRRGHGPEEYSGLYGVQLYDEPAHEVFVFCEKGCLVYSEDGSYRRTLSLSRDKNYVEAYSFDSESVLAFNANTESDSAYIFLSKKDGSILSCIHLPKYKRIPLEKRTIVGDMVYYTQIFGQVQALLRDGDDFILSDISSDTIYRYTKDRKLIPLLARTPSVADYEIPHICFIFKVTDKCIYGADFVVDIDGNITPTIKSWVYEKESNRFFSGYFNPDYFINAFQPGRQKADFPKNRFAFISSDYGIKTLMEDLEKGELEGRLKEVAEKYDADDNPIIQVVKFK